MLTFWLLAPLMVLAALGILVVRKAVHAALLLAVVMISLAVLYAVLEAPFLFAVQIIVYTGAILMLFLFVLMLVGVDASDSVVETIKGQRVTAAVLGLLLGAVLVIGFAQVSLGLATGMEAANAGGNVEGLADLLFSDFVFAFEATSALLITAAVGAMVLAHRERLTPKVTQAEMAARRMRAYADRGAPLGPLASPGVFARHNAVDTPALLPDGSPAPTSVSRLFTTQGATRPAHGLVEDIEDVTRGMRTDGRMPPGAPGEQATPAEDRDPAAGAPSAARGTDAESARDAESSAQPAEPEPGGR